MPTLPLTPTPLDQIKTATSNSQVSTEIDIQSILLRWIDNPDQLTQPIDSVILSRSSHTAYIYPNLSRLPVYLTALDASRTWIMYWVVGALSLLGTRIREDERTRAIKTVLAFQHPDGGFGGGPGQIAHLASTFAAICALATLLDGANPTLVNDTWSQINRKKMLHWILSLKMQDGSYAMHHGGEIDVRGSYAMLATATLLNLLTPEIVHGVPEYLVSCQTYEGGISATSISIPDAQDKETTPGGGPKAAPIGEAHGGYASCALAADFLLKGLPSLSASPRLNYHSCLRWATHMQGFPIEGGGFRGRTNKLVDGCYSWWCGGLFPLLQALLSSNSPEKLDSIDLFDRQALQEYILLIAQDLTPKAKQGGLRDKPSVPPDLYHTHYILSGLSTAQHRQKHCGARVGELRAGFKPPQMAACILGQAEAEAEALVRMKEAYSRALGWRVVEDKELIVGLLSNKILPIHPVFNIKLSAVESTMKYFYHQN